ncbi:MAG: hypothetical protein IJ242_03445, partial [Clostridia bacterium]|nr:hypothetical protein [Clostridia bacterium]
MKTVRKTSVFPAKRDIVFSKLKDLSTLQYIAAPYASFMPVNTGQPAVFAVGNTSVYRFRLFGIIPFGTHTIHIERFDPDGIQNRESNTHVPVWNHKITLKDRGDLTEYTDEVDIDAGWKTVFIWLWTKAFYAHRQKKWIRL